jgi:CBS domain containing-hemolysin-like protein
VSPQAALILVLIGLGLWLVAAVGARSLSDFSRHELEERCRRRGAANRLGEILLRHEAAALAAETLQTVGAVIVLGAGAWWFHLEMRPEFYPGWLPLVAALAIVALVVLAVGVWLPRAIAGLWAEPILCRTWPLWRGVDLLLAPLTLGARWTHAAFHRLAGRAAEIPDEDSFEEEIRTVVTEGHREGLLEEEARDMIEGIIELGDVDVSEIMTPRTDMVTIPADLNWEEMLNFVKDSTHTRIPVHGRTRDEIVGLLHSKDLLPPLVHSRQAPAGGWTSLLRKAYFVPETKPVDVLLQEFQQTRNHMAIVLDEYGGVSGLVTLEDVLEEIVGEITDEYDRETQEDIEEVGSGKIEALGRAHIDEINERLGLELPEDADYDTIGGFVFSELGHVPVVGEVLQWKNARVTVLEATSRRIERVRIELPDRVESA